MAHASEARHVVVADRVLTRRVQGELVILDLESETYLGLDQVGARVWDALTTSSTVEEALTVLTTRYDVLEATLRRDVEDLLDKLTRRGLLVLRGGAR